jgi:hypothetical protein
MEEAAKMMADSELRITQLQDGLEAVKQPNDLPPPRQSGFRNAEEMLMSEA